MIPKLAAQTLMSLAFPTTCLGCESRIEIQSNHVEENFRDQFCLSCWKQLPRASVAGCPTCGSFINRPITFGDRCALCFDQKFYFAYNVAMGSYSGLLKQMILQMKRDMDEPLGFHLGRLLGSRLIQHGVLENVDILVPVPIHWRRLLKRGFHAAHVIAEGVSSLSPPKVRNLVRCRRLTKKQGKLTGNNRFKNVKDSFALKPLTNVADAHVLIVDDVMTSGATLNEMAKMLLQAGAAEVKTAVVGRATGNNPVTF